MARKSEIAGYIGDMTQLDMVLDARLVLTRDGATPAEWAANSMLIERYSKGAWTATGTAPAVRVTGTPVPADTDVRPAEWQRPTGGGSGNGSGTRTGNGVTPGQRDLYTRLVNDNLTDELRTIALAQLDTFNTRTIRPVIDNLIKMDRARQQQERTAARTGTSGRKTPEQLDASLPQVPTGRYRALGRNIKADFPTQGQWAGRVFLVELDDEGHKMDRITRHAEKLELLTAIAADVHGCVVAFGIATGICGRCDTPLEDPESIARGIGPYCEGKSRGMTYAQIKADRKANPVATINQPPTTPAAAPVAATQTPAAAPAPAPHTEATPAPAPTADVLTGLTPDTVDALTFPQAMTIAKAIKLPGRGTARLPQLRDGIKSALTLAA